MDRFYFSFSTFEYAILLYMASYEKSALHLHHCSIYAMGHFSLATLWFSFFDMQGFGYGIQRCGPLHVYPTWFVGQWSSDALACVLLHCKWLLNNRMGPHLPLL